MRDVQPDPEVNPEQLEADPYPIYARLRAHAPVCFVPELDMWLVTRYSDVERVAGDPQTFAVDARDSQFTSTIGTSMVSLDGEPHARVRAAFEPAVASGVKRFEERTAAMMDEALARISPSGSADLMGEVIVPVSVAAIADTLGLSAHDPDTVRGWFAELEAGAFEENGDVETKAAGYNASRAVGAIMATLTEHHNTPEGSVLASLAHSTLSLEEVIPNLKLMMLGPAGFVGLVLWSLLVHPGALAAVRRERALLPKAVSEALRWQSPEGATTRIARSTTLIADAEIPTGATVAAVIASANRDERRYSEPDRFVINRHEAHAAFSFGPHSCPGAGLAQLQTRMMVERLVSGLPGLRLDPDQPAQISGWMSRAPASLPARWDA